MSNNKEGGNMSEEKKSKNILEAIVYIPASIGLVVLTTIACLVITWLLLWFVTIFVHIGADLQAYERCGARGYKKSEVVVHHPFFWNVDTYCYEGEKRDGVKL